MTSPERLYDPDVYARNNGPYYMIEDYEGWKDLVNECHRKLVEIAPDYRVFQIKEKFGGLRYYIDRSSDEICDIIREAESKSTQTCMDCGAPGSLRYKGYWMVTLCDADAERRGAETIEEEDNDE